MSRPLRIEYPKAWYHVMNQGRRSEKIFYDSQDYKMKDRNLKERIGKLQSAVLKSHEQT
jgi:hypothetical protein